MPHPQLDNLVRSGLLKAEAAEQSELDGLIESAARRLRDAENEALSLDSRFDLLYNAAHALGLAALRWHGYRPANNRSVVFQALAHTLSLAPGEWRVLSEAHRKRNAMEYEGVADVDGHSWPRSCVSLAGSRSASAVSDRSRERRARDDARRTG